jgi:hypothetical protein
VAGQAIALLHLGVLYINVLGRPEDAVTHFRQAAGRCATQWDLATELRSSLRRWCLLLKGAIAGTSPSRRCSTTRYARWLLFAHQRSADPGSQIQW